MVLPSIVALRGRSELAVWSSCRATAAKLETTQERNWQPSLRSLFVDEKRGWAAGVEGTIISTVDGGLTWKRQQSGIEKHLLAIAFANDSQGVAAGAEGTLIVTSDGGSTWQLAQQKPVETKELLQPARCLCSSAFKLLGCRVLRTNLPQQRRRQILVGAAGNSTSQLYGITFIDDKRGWVAGADGTVLSTSDSGANWNAEVSNSAQLFNAISFISETHGWVAGESGVILAADAGKTWTPQTSGPIEMLNSVHFVDEQNGWAVGAVALILRTKDGGKTWERQKAETTTNLRGVHFLDLRQGWIVGERGTILNTSDGGTTWVAKPIVPIRAFTAFCGKFGLDRGRRRTHSSYSGWRLSEPPEFKHLLWLETVCFINAKTGWAAGEGGALFQLPMAAQPGQSVKAARGNGSPQHLIC